MSFQHLSGNCERHVRIGEFLRDIAPAPNKKVRRFPKSWGFPNHPTYPLVMTNIAIEHGHRHSEYSHDKWVDLSIVFFVNVYQAG